MDRNPFVRDVAVNVIANLVAASILYLVGVGVGLLPTNGTLLLTAAFLVSFVLGIALWIVQMAIFRGRRGFKSRGLIMLSTAAVSLGASGILAALIPGTLYLSPFEKILYIIAGVSLITQAALTAYSELRSRRT